jgi:putative ABC transport system permease protein
MSDLHFGRRLRQFFWKPDPATEIREEVDHHIELIVRELMAKGMARSEAEAEARRRFGTRQSVEQTCEQIAGVRDRRNRRAVWFSDLKDDLRYAIRSLRHSPGYAATTGLTLSIAIAANTTVFSLVNGVLIRALPYPAPNELVVIEELTSAGGEPWELSLPTLEAVRAQATSLERVGGWLSEELTLKGEPDQRIQVAMVDQDFFPALQTPPTLGVPLAEPDQVSGGVAVISHGLWQARFGGDSSALGQRIELEGNPFTVVGVMPPSFAIPAQTIEAWIPLGTPPGWMRTRSVHLFRPVARLAPGTSVEAARTELDRLMTRIQLDYPGEDPGHTFQVRPLDQAITGNVRTTLLVLFAAVLCLLLLAATNVAGLTLMRSRAREGEFSVRTALGASRGRLTRQLLVEGLLVATIGAGGGILLATLGLRRILSWLPEGLPRMQDIRLDGRVLGFTLAIAAGTGLLLGLIPAFRAGSSALRASLAAVGRASVGPSRQRVQRSLVVIQIAIGLVLVTGASLLVRSFRAVQAVDVGFEAAGLSTLTLSVPPGYDRAQTIDFYRRLPGVLRSTPGIREASGTSSLPISGGDAYGGLTIEGRNLAEGQEVTASFRRVLPNYFQAMGIPRIRGREFDERDEGGAGMVVIINQTMADRFWPGEDPLGARIKIGVPESEPWLTIVGVVADVRNLAVEETPRYDTYEPHAQRSRRTMTVVLRGEGDPVELGESARRSLLAVQSDLPIWGIGTMEERIDRSLAPRRFNTAVLTGFGAVALGLALLGVYGVTANAVATRRKEFGIRIALGAQAFQIGRLVVMQAMLLSGLGILIGLPLALLFSDALGSMLFQVSTTDPTAYAITVGLLLTAAITASWIPARRALGVSPMTTLREE